ncbi:MAG: peptidoglycan binding domain-containing protein [Eubacteriales bacterium]|nr:peptidoglycan binding domain-containing protein [Eubacteriales bacterium]
MRKKITIIAIIILLALAGAGYAGGVSYFSLHFLPGTKVNGIDCSFKTVSEAEAMIQEQARVYVLAIDEKDNAREKLTAEQVGLTYRSKNRLEEFLCRQEKEKWFLSFQEEYVLEKTACTEYDEEKLKEAIAALRCMQKENVTPPQNAGFRDNGECFEVTAAVPGNELDFEKIVSVIGDAILSGEREVNLVDTGCYLEPEIYETDPLIQENLEIVNKMGNVILTYDLGNSSERVDRSVIVDWLLLDESGRYTVDREKARAYVAQLAAKYDVIGGDQTFRTYDGREITVGGGNYGWVIDQEAETEALISDIQNGVIQVREPMYSIHGSDRKNGGIGKTYVEIDLTAQRMVLYKDGYLALDTPIVSGDPLWSATPTGCYRVGEKESPHYLEDEVKTVSFWIPFTENLGIHDASWRTEFGADLYTIIGSEGGIDIPFDAARTVYESLDTGDPIIIYQ